MMFAIKMQQSTDGVTFTTTDRVTARNTAVENQYAVALEAGADRMFYRLKMVDMDGKTIYSSITIVTLNCYSAVNLYPNPAQNVLFVSNIEPGSLYSVTDNNGKHILSGKSISTMLNVNISALSSGMYYITVKSLNGETRSLKFVKQQ